MMNTTERKQRVLTGLIGPYQEMYMKNPHFKNTMQMLTDVFILMVDTMAQRSESWQINVETYKELLTSQMLEREQAAIERHLRQRLTDNS